MKRLDLNVGVCIYCGSNNPPLTREHVMPRGLGGNWAPAGDSDALVLEDASCETCRQVTQEIEQKCLQLMMDPGRAKLGLKRKDRLSGSVKARIVTMGGVEEDREVDWDCVPGPVVLPAYHEAGLFSQRRASSPTPCDYKMIIISPATRAVEQNVTEVGVTLSVSPIFFARMLGKIALGVAVAGLGVAGFEPFVREIILNKAGDWGRWIGGFAGSGHTEPPATALHSVVLKSRAGPSGDLVIVLIRLFASFGGPTNYVVVGKRA